MCGSPGITVLKKGTDWLKRGIVVGFHPGTVDTSLSKPFQSGVPEGKLFSPIYSAREMLRVIDALGPEASGQCYDYAGKLISF